VDRGVFSALLLETGAALAAGNADLSLPSGYPKLQTTGGALEDLILSALSQLDLPAGTVTPLLPS
jgi:hypothetical protein